jgi:Uncharacterised protein family (UPF0139)
MTVPMTTPDPRRPDLVEPFELPMLSEEEAIDSSLYQFVGLLMGIMSIMSANKYSAWIGMKTIT